MWETRTDRLLAFVSAAFVLAGQSPTSAPLRSVGSQSVQSAPQTATSAAGDEAAQIDRMFSECEDLIKNGRHDDLAGRAEEASRLSRKLGDKARLAKSLNYLMSAHFYRSRNEDAVEVGRQVIPLVSEITDRSIQARALNNMGVALRELREYDQALDLLSRARDLYLQIGDRLAAANTSRNIAVLYGDLGVFEKAEAMLRESLQVARALKNQVYEQIFLMVLANAERGQGRLQDALRDYEGVLALDAKTALPAARIEILANMALLYEKLGQHEKAIDVARQSLEAARASNYREAEAAMLSHIGSNLHALGRLDEALEWLTRARAVFRAAGNFAQAEWSTDLELARVQRGLGRAEEALASAQEALSAIEQVRLKAVPIEMSSGGTVIATSRDAFVETIDLLFSLERPRDALNVAERYRARVFLDMLAESRVRARRALTALQRGREEALSARISAIQKDLRQEEVPANRRRQLEGALAAAEDDFETFRLELRRTNPAYASVQYPDVLGAERIQRELLDRDTVLIEYVLGEKQSFVWALSQTRVRAATLPGRKEIDSLVAAYRRTLTKLASSTVSREALADVDHQSGNLYARLVKPVEDDISSKRNLIIVPDGMLAYLPFETLRVPRPSPIVAPAAPAAGRTGLRRRPEYLLERFAVSYTPSASALAAIRARTNERSAPAKLLLAFGDPSYDPASGRHPAMGARSTAPHLTTSFDQATYLERGFRLVRLPYTRTEILEISRLYAPEQRQLYLGRQASEESVKAENLDEYRYLHFATHGMIDEDKPARSAIALSFDPSSKEDGVLQMREIIDLSLNADLVTLSACSTGLGKLMSGEGMIGLTRAFFYAGARSVMVSLWNVNDIATAELMKNFYKNLNRGLSKDEALRKAKLALATGREASWRHPYFWAPFVLMGERN